MKQKLSGQDTDFYGQRIENLVLLYKCLRLRLCFVIKENSSRDVQWRINSIQYLLNHSTYAECTAALLIN
jgi:hypothetical protein